MKIETLPLSNATPLSTRRRWRKPAIALVLALLAAGGWPARARTAAELLTAEHDGRIVADVVGPVCETGDYLALSRDMPELKAGDLIAIMTAGAYGMTMASNYNTRGRAAEVIVDGDQVHQIRQRENPADLFALESMLK